MSLRLKEGLNIAKFNSFSDLKLKQTRIKNLIDLDLITVSHGNLVKTDKGEILLNTLIGKLID